jgi:hypothetical protein
MYNRVNVNPAVFDSGSGYTYTSATVRESRGSTTNQINFVVGLVEDGVLSSHGLTVNTVAVANAGTFSNQGLNSTTVGSGVSARCIFNAGAAAQNCQLADSNNFVPVLGVNFIASLEEGDGANANTLSGAFISGTFRQ